MIEQLISSLLQINATWVSANLLDSEDNEIRVYHQRIPQGHAFPCVVFHILTDVSGYVKGAVKNKDFTVSFVVYHDNDFEAATIAANLETIVEGYAGTYAGNTWLYTMHLRTVDGYNDVMDMPQKTLDFQFTKAI